MADYKINSINHLFSGAPNNMPSTTYAASKNSFNQTSQRAQVTVQASRSVSNPYTTVNTHREKMRNESIKRAKLRREAIKSDNLKEPLVNCPVCGMKLGLDTEECPNCCHKMKNKMDDNKKTLILIVIALLILLIPLFKNLGILNFDFDFQQSAESFFSEIDDAFADFLEDEIY